MVADFGEEAKNMVGAGCRIGEDIEEDYQINKGHSGPTKRLTVVAIEEKGFDVNK